MGKTSPITTREEYDHALSRADVLMDIIEKLEKKKDRIEKELDEIVNQCVAYDEGISLSRRPAGR